MSKLQSKGKLEWISASEVKISPRAQRDYNEQWAKKIASEFNPDAFAIPSINRRANGTLYCMDGQHRFAALTFIGYSDQLVQCNVFDGLSEKDEADMFLLLNNKLNTTKYDHFRIAVSAGWPKETEVASIVKGAGVKIARSSADGTHTFATAALLSVFTKHGPRTLDRTLRLIRMVYPEDASALHQDTIRGFAAVCARYEEQFSDAEMVRRFEAVGGGVSKLRQIAQQEFSRTGASREFCMSAAIVDIYNSKRGKKLETWWAEMPKIR
jgi:hypothetical protein